MSMIEGTGSRPPCILSHCGKNNHPPPCYSQDVTLASCLGIMSFFSETKPALIIDNLWYPWGEME